MFRALCLILALAAAARADRFVLDLYGPSSPNTTVHTVRIILGLPRYVIDAAVVDTIDSKYCSTSVQLPWDLYRGWGQRSLSYRQLPTTKYNGSSEYMNNSFVDYMLCPGFGAVWLSIGQSDRPKFCIHPFMREHPEFRYVTYRPLPEQIGALIFSTEIPGALVSGLNFGQCVLQKYTITKKENQDCVYVLAADGYYDPVCTITYSDVYTPAFSFCARTGLTVTPDFPAVCPGNNAGIEAVSVQLSGSIEGTYTEDKCDTVGLLAAGMYMVFDRQTNQVALSRSCMDTRPTFIWHMINTFAMIGVMWLINSRMFRFWQTPRSNGRVYKSMISPSVRFAVLAYGVFMLVLAGLFLAQPCFVSESLNFVQNTRFTESRFADHIWIVHEVVLASLGLLCGTMAVPTFSVEMLVAGVACFGLHVIALSTVYYSTVQTVVAIVNSFFVLCYAVRCLMLLIPADWIMNQHHLHRHHRKHHRHRSDSDSEVTVLKDVTVVTDEIAITCETVGVCSLILVAIVSQVYTMFPLTARLMTGYDLISVLLLQVFVVLASISSVVVYSVLELTVLHPRLEVDKVK